MVIAVIFFCSSDNKISSPHMINYCSNSLLCRRQMLFNDFDDTKKPCHAVIYARRCVIVIFVQHQSISLDMLLLIYCYMLLTWTVCLYIYLVYV